MGNLDIVEQQETIVHSAEATLELGKNIKYSVSRNLLITEFRANIANVYIVQGLVGLQVTDLDNERMRPEVLAVDKQLSHYDSMICCPAQ